MASVTTFRLAADGLAHVVLEHPTVVGYGASRDGRIWSRWKFGPGGLVADWQRELRSTPSGPSGHLNFKAKGKTQWVHRFVLECWVGPCPPGMECRHLDGDGSNNAVGNLAWGTHAENMADMVAHSQSARGGRHPSAKLTEQDVRSIRGDRRTNRAIAIEFGVSASTVSCIKSGKRWGHVAPAVSPPPPTASPPDVARRLATR